LGKPSRDKGLRVERELVNKLKESGVDAKRVPLSGAAEGFKGDIQIGDLIAEVKARKDGAGFKTLEHWLGDNDVLFLKKNNTDPMVILTWDLFVEMIKYRKK
tara:strand:- start:528 stop:833 length:306 start_codon:yes stop_codon:yes gene_type:complete